MEQWRAWTAGPALEPIRRPASPSETGPRPAAPPGAADRPTPSLRAVRRALAARESLRQAVLLQEILGPPKALQPPARGLSQLLDGRPLS
jgi:hypothetical protein